MRVKKRMIAAAPRRGGCIRRAGLLLPKKRWSWFRYRVRTSVPPVKTSASGDGMFTVTDDGKDFRQHHDQGHPGERWRTSIMALRARTVRWAVKKLEKSGNTYTVPAGTKLDADQMKAYKAGELYVNVHSAENKGGEIRGQRK